MSDIQSASKERGSRTSRFLNKIGASRKSKSHDRESAKGTDDKRAVVRSSPLDELPDITGNSHIESLEDIPPKQDDTTVPNTSKTLWEKAFEEVEASEDFKGFVTRYQKILLNQSPNEELPSLAKQKDGMKSLIEKQRKTLEDGRWGFVLLGRSFKAADLVSLIVQGITKVDGVIGQVLRGTGEPHAAMVMAGVSVLLPLITHPAAQDKSALELLGVISDRTQRYYLYEETLSNTTMDANVTDAANQLKIQMQTKLFALYTEILKAQISLACKFARSSFLQYGRDIIKLDSWTKMQEDISKKENDLTADIQAFDSALGTASMIRLNAIASEIRDIKVAIESQSQISVDKKSEEFLANFSSTLDYQGTAGQVDDSITGTNEWAPKDPRYTSWSDAKISTTLMIKGGAGRGKSVLLKYLVTNELATSFRRLSAYFFFHSGSDQERSAVECMSALVYQIFEQRPDLVKAAREAFPNVNENTRYSFQTLSKIIGFCIRDFDGEIVLVLDGLDECETLDSPASMARGSSLSNASKDSRLQKSRFFDWLATLPKINSKGLIVKLLCSLRTGADTAYHTSEAFKSLHKTELDLNNEEEGAGSDLRLYIKTKVTNLSLGNEKQEDLITMLVDLQKSSGSYLWLKLVFELLKKPMYQSMPVASFKNYLLQGETDRVDKEFSELLPKEPEQQKIAKIVFGIVLGARRPLTTMELAGAVEVVAGHEIALDRPDVLADYCGAFVEITTINSTRMAGIDESKPKLERRVVNFFHDRARGFLLALPQTEEKPVESTTMFSIFRNALSAIGVPQVVENNVQEIQMPERFHHGFSKDYVDSFVLDTCVKYIKFKASKGTVDGNLSSMTSYDRVTDWIPKYLRDNPFMVYASIHWINHLPLDETNRAIQSQVIKQVQDLLDISSVTFRTWFLCNWSIWAPNMSLERFFRQYVTAFVTDHLQPTKQLRRRFDLEDPGVKGAWLWWKMEGDLSEFTNYLVMCEPGYEMQFEESDWIHSMETTPFDYRPELRSEQWIDNEATNPNMR